MAGDRVEVTISADAAPFVAGTKSAQAATEQLRASYLDLRAAMAGTTSLGNETIAALTGAGTAAKAAAAGVAATGAAAAQAAAGMKGVSAAAKEAASAQEGLKLATSGVYRELIVLPHEILTGNFSRIPGSLMVLLERMGSLRQIIEGITPAMIAGGGAAAVLTAGIAALAVAALHAADRARELGGALNVMGRGGDASRVQSIADQLRQTFGGTAADANEVAVTIGKIPVATELARNAMQRYAEIWAAASKDETSAGDAAKEIARAASEGAAGVEKLAETYAMKVSPEQKTALDNAKATNDAIGAQVVLIQLLAQRFEPAAEAAKKLADYMRGMEPLAAGLGGVIPPPATSMVPPIQTGVAKSAADAQEEAANRERARQAGIQTPIIEQNYTQQMAVVTASLDKQKEAIDKVKAAEEERAKAAAAQIAILRATTDSAKEGSVERVALAQKEVTGTIALAGRGSVAAIEAQTRLTQATQAEVDKRTQIVMKGITDQIAVLDRQLAAQLKNDQAATALHQVSIQQGQALELAAVDAFTSQEIALIDREIAAAAAAYGRDSANFQAAEDRKTQILEQAEAQREQIRNKGATDQQSADAKAAQQMQDALRPVTQAFDTFFQGVISGHKTMAAAAMAAVSQMTLSFIDNIAKGTVEYAAQAAIQLAIHKTVAMSQKLTDAETAAANVYASVSAIPIVGWALAPVAAAAAFAAVEAFDIGTNAVPQDMLAMVHAGEIIIPAGASAAMRSGGASAAPFNAAAFGPSGGGGTLNNNVTVAVSAMNSRDMMAAMNDPAFMRQFARQLFAYAGNNPSVRGSY